MKLYMVRGYEYNDQTDEDFINMYGVFSTREKAEEIANNLREVAEIFEDERYEVEECELDEPLELYYFMMSCN